ncbi:MAG: hypothetical protein HS115_14290 [Spirochaetales bacterium]|nr:hypothetical protein [Spirochaetales bacterium]
MLTIETERNLAQTVLSVLPQNRAEQQENLANEYAVNSAQRPEITLEDELKAWELASDIDFAASDF